MFRACERIVERELQDEVRALRERHSGAGKLVADCGRAALDKVTAHDNDQVVCAGSLFCLAQKITVSVMQWIEFRDDAECFQNSPFLFEVIILS